MDLSRVVDVSASTPTDLSFGSGFLVAPGLVLTARHVVCGDDGNPFDEPHVRLTEEGTPLRCRVVWPGRPDLDAALLECTAPVAGFELAGPVRWGQLIASETGVKCEAAGFPRAMAQDSGLREVDHMRGEINTGTGLLGDRIYADVRSAWPEPGGWQGMSGAALWCGPLLVGVVAWDQAAYKARRLAAEPVTRLFADPGFRSLIGADVAIEAVELAGRRPRVPVPAPAYLLRADAATARFRSRAGELARLAAWCEGPGVRVRLLTGAGGQGKTRLARELAARLAMTGQWAAEMIQDGAQLPSSVRRPLLAVVDYAETRPDQAADLILSALSGSGDTPVRLLLLARRAGDWWDRLCTSTAELEMALTGTVVDELAALDDTPTRRAQAFNEAVHDYAQALHAMSWPSADPESVTVPDLAREEFGSALRLQMSALAALLADGQIGPGQAEDVILAHETRYWRRTAREHDLHAVEQTMRCAVAAATLCGAADQDQATALLTRVPGLRDQAEDVRLLAARWLRDLYPPPADLPGPAERHNGQRPYWGPLQPDLLAEHLVAAVADAFHGYLALLEQTSAEQNHQALTVLSRAAATRPGLAGSLTQLLAKLPNLAPTAVRVATQSERPGPIVAALTGLAEHHDLQFDALVSISDAIPGSTNSLARFAVTIAQKLVTAQELVTAEEPARHRRPRLGRRRHQPEREPDGDPAHLHELAGSLIDLSGRLGKAGRRDEALAASQRALKIWERLAQASPDAYLPAQATSLNNLSIDLAELRRYDEALAASQRAVKIWKRLAKTSPDAYLPELATSLSNLSLRLDKVGRADEALAASRRAVRLCEQLAQANPDIYLPDLASALNNLSLQLAEGYWWDPEEWESGNALEVTQRAVELYEQLAQANPDAYLPQLAMSLYNLARRLDDMRGYDEALAPIQRAVELYEQLAQANPDEHLPDLAMSLNTLAGDLAEVGRRAEGLAAIERAVAISEQLADAHPQIFGRDLARSLANLGTHLRKSDPVRAVKPLLRAWTLAGEHDYGDLLEYAADELRQAHSRKPKKVAAEFERLTGQPWGGGLRSLA